MAAGSVPCPECEALRRAVRVLADEVARQRRVSLEIAERLYRAAEVLAIRAERRECRKL